MLTDPRVRLPALHFHREGAAQETGNAVWDPLGLADLGSPATLAWFRHAELKHGRVAMAAFTGWLVAAGNQLALKNGHEGLHFPGAISPFQTGTTFADIAAAGGPMEQWQAVPEIGKLQIIGASACHATASAPRRPAAATCRRRALARSRSALWCLSPTLLLLARDLSAALPFRPRSLSHRAPERVEAQAALHGGRHPG
jgi:hypothetical protein